MNDQAKKLRDQMALNSLQARQNRVTRVVTVTSGKGGVGKSNFSLNFALSLIEMGQKVLILDADLGLANIDVLMGITPKHNLHQMIEQRTPIWEIIEKGPGGLEFIAGRSGFTKISMLDDQKLSYLFEQLNLLEGYADTIIIDTGAGMSKESLQFILSADEVCLVTTPEPTALTDAYAIIKMVHSKNPGFRPRLIVNRVHSMEEGPSTADRLSLVAKKFLGAEILYMGFIFEDGNVSKSVKKQEPFYLAYPNSPASINMRGIARAFLEPGTQFGADPKGVKGFLRKMLNLIK